MRESTYQAQLIKKLTRLFPHCIILKNDSSYRQGVPDLVVLYGQKWAALEVKASVDAPEQPNQHWYISEMNHMSFAAFIYPENEEDVLHALQQTFTPRRRARIS